MREKRVLMQCKVLVSILASWLCEGRDLSTFWGIAARKLEPRVGDPFAPGDSCDLKVGEVLGLPILTAGGLPAMGSYMQARLRPLSEGESCGNSAFRTALFISMPIEQANEHVSNFERCLVARVKKPTGVRQCIIRLPSSDRDLWQKKQTKLDNASQKLP